MLFNRQSCFICVFITSPFILIKLANALVRDFYFFTNQLRGICAIVVSKDSLKRLIESGVSVEDDILTFGFSTILIFYATLSIRKLVIGDPC